MKGIMTSSHTDGRSLRYGLIVPMALMILSIVSSCLSYFEARRDIASDLNDAMLALANENSELWTRQDTIAALRHMHAATHKPAIYRADDVNFRNPALKDAAYFTLALVDKPNSAARIHDDKIVSDSIMLVPEKAVDGVAVQVQGFADCSVASVFAASDQTLPAVFFVFSLLSMTGMVIWRRKDPGMIPTAASIDDVRLTPMQRRFARMLLDAPDHKVDKATLCEVLWDNKINAEESLYTLVRRTKSALAGTGIEIVCNRGESYEIRING